MTFEERLDKLTSRHEAFSQSLEILTHDVEGLKVSISELRDTMRESSTGMMSILQGILEVAKNHENRIFRLENGNGKQQAD